MPDQGSASSLSAFTEQVIIDREPSAARARQLRWIVGELDLARGHPEFPFPEISAVHDLLQPGPISAYLALAARGELRRRAKAGDARATNASMRIRADCLKILGESAGLSVDIPDRPGLPELRETVDGPSRSQLRDYLAARADSPTAPPGRVRLFAIVGVVLDTGVRVGELCAMRMTDLDDGLFSIRVVRKPQARSVSAPVEERVPLSAGARSAIRAWLLTREELIKPVQGGAKALWVSVSANHAGTLTPGGGALRRPPGMPLMPRGMQRAYTRAVVEANVQLVGSPGWRPLPYRFEQLRRAVTAREAAEPGSAAGVVEADGSR